MVIDCHAKIIGVCGLFKFMPFICLRLKVVHSYLLCPSLDVESKALGRPELNTPLGYQLWQDVEIFPKELMPFDGGHRAVEDCIIHKKAYGWV